jgi:predicted MPP superfamily phosphohydrolase
MADVMSRRKFLRLTAAGIGGVGLSAITGSAYITKIEPDLIDITHVQIPLANLPKAFDGWTIAQISDLHLGDWTTRQRMINVVQQVNALAPDVIAITGDFVSVVTYDVVDDIRIALGGLKAREGVLAVLGNHDHWTHAPSVRAAIASTHVVRLLTNEHLTFKRNGETLYFAGVDDIWENQHNLDAALNGIPAKSPVVLLAHEPDYADEVAKTGRVGLQLSGHSHGGQVRLPGIGALVLPYLGEKYNMGRYDVNGLQLYVNRGIGMVRPLVRFNCRPEITLLTLVAQK